MAAAASGWWWTRAPTWSCGSRPPRSPNSVSRSGVRSCCQSRRWPCGCSDPPLHWGMTRARLTRVVRFSAAHRYFRPDWSPEENTRVFGLCAREHGHGHNYRCAVTVAGPVADFTGMVTDLGALDQLLNRVVRE